MLLKNNLINIDLLEKVKNQLKGGLILGLESTSSRMSRLAKNEIHLNTFYTLDDIIKRIDDVSINDVNNVAQDIFKNEDYFTTIIKPK